MTQAVIGVCFLMTNVKITFYVKLRKLILRKNNQPLTSKHYWRLKRYEIMKIVDTEKLTECGSGENDDSNIRYYCKTEELFDVLETTHVKIGHKRTRGKRHCLVCDSQKHSLYLFVSFFQPWKLN